MTYTSTKRCISDNLATLYVERSDWSECYNHDTKIPILVHIHVSRILFSAPTGDFCCPMLTIVKTVIFNFWPQNLLSCTVTYINLCHWVNVFLMIYDSLGVLFFCSSIKHFVPASLYLSQTANLDGSGNTFFRYAKHVQHALKYRHMQVRIICEFSQAPAIGEDALWSLTLRISSLQCSWTIDKQAIALVHFEIVYLASTYWMYMH